MDNGLNSSFTYTQSYRLFLSVFAEKRYILCKLLTISKLLSRHDKNMDIQKKTTLKTQILIANILQYYRWIFLRLYY